jgi:hypothetical protein
MSKAAVRELASAEGLRPAAKRSSAGICFIGRRPFGEFIEQYVPPRPGRFLDAESGADLGPCRNLLALTPGQRAPISGGAARRYIAGKDLAAGVAWVAPCQDHPALLSRSGLLLPARWVAGTQPRAAGGGGGGGWGAPGLACSCQARYRQEEVRAVVQAAPDGWRPAPDGAGAGRPATGATGASGAGAMAASGLAFQPSRYMAGAMEAAIAAFMPPPGAAASDAGGAAGGASNRTPNSSGGGGNSSGGCAAARQAAVGGGPFLRLALYEPLRGLAPGQAVVLYDGPVVLGSALLAAPGPTLAEGG